jgi:hypothetical protein
MKKKNRKANGLQDLPMACYKVREIKLVGVAVPFT